MTTYQVKMVFNEKLGSKLKHSVEETYECVGEKCMKKTLCDVLDIPNEGGVPTEPSIDVLKDSLGRYVEDKFIEKEFKRQKKNYKLFNSMMNDASLWCSSACVCGNVDKKTTVSVSVVEDKYVP